jgi:hypothetical protein
MFPLAQPPLTIGTTFSHQGCCTALSVCSLRTHIVQLQLRIEKLRKNPGAFDVPSDPAEERTAADIVQVSEMVSGLL